MTLRDIILLRAAQLEQERDESEEEYGSEGSQEEEKVEDSLSSHSEKERQRKQKRKRKDKKKRDSDDEEDEAEKNIPELQRVAEKNRRIKAALLKKVIASSLVVGCILLVMLGYSLSSYLLTRQVISLADTTVS